MLGLFKSKEKKFQSALEDLDLKKVRELLEKGVVPNQKYKDKVQSGTDPVFSFMI